MKQALDVSNLNLSAGKKDILKNVSFSVKENEFVCLVGPNGAGKSSLLKSIVRIMPSDSGVIKSENIKLLEIKQKKLASLVAYVPQNLKKVPPFSVYEFVAMSRFPYKNFNHSLTKKDLTIINNSIKDVDLEEFKSSILTTLSGGELQRVMIAAAIAQQTKILLLDEPFASQDPHHQEEIYSLLFSLKNKLSISVLCVCHDLNIATRLSDRIIAIKAGEIIFDGIPKSFIEENIMQKLYETEFIKINADKNKLPFLFTKGIARE